jgi:ribonuclease R
MPNKKRFRSKNYKNKAMSGVLSVNSRGVGYFKLRDKDFISKNPKEVKDIEIQNNNLNTALNGDTVLVSIISDRRSSRVNGKVIKIEKRAKKVFTGILNKQNNNYFLSADDKRMYTNILINSESVQKKQANVGQKILVKMTKWDKKSPKPEGEIIMVLGQAGEHNTEMKAILYEKGFEIDFPDQVEAEAKILGINEKKISKEEISERRDFRDTITFTIDPKDAKDFDDAISIKQLDKDKYEVGVHIADVSHYVREKTALDEEALKRSFSVYLVDRTIPMLPEVLSNDICSLNENEEKLTFSAVFEMNSQGKILSRWFGKTIIRSAKRFTYEKAQEVLDQKNNNSSNSSETFSLLNGVPNRSEKVSDEFFTELNTLNEIAKKLRKEKVANGAIDFEQDEVTFELDEAGKPIKISKKSRLDTHKLVEEYMLLANKEVAEFIFNNYKKTNSSSPFIYRIHNLPDNDRIMALSIFVKALGYELPIQKGKSVRAIDLQNLFKQIQGKAEEAIIKTAALRSMAKAIYSTQNTGHFGLAFEFYTHFTSPIRRYPDLLVHRLLQKHLKNEKLQKTEWIKYEKISVEATEKEIKAAEAERDSKKYKQVEYMQNKVGQEFFGIITGVTDWGVYVEEKETRAEGMVKIKDLGNEYFTLDTKNYCLIAEKSKKKFSLGDKVKFKIIGTDLEKKAIDCIFV